MYVFDTESCGFHGPTTLIQYQEVDDPTIVLHEVFCEPIWSTLQLIESFCEKGVIGFNLTHDWFHISKTFTILQLLAERVGYDEEPRDHIDLYAELEPLGRDGPCVKPVTSLDLLLYARKGPYQSTMDRKAIRIKRIPVVLATALVSELEKRIILPDYLFKRKKHGESKWKIFPCKDYKTGKQDPEFVDLVLKFSASVALKVLAHHALGVSQDEIITYGSADPDLKPVEAGWAPFALAISNPSKGWRAKVGNKKGLAWPGVIKSHIRHWRFDETGRKYATDDVKYTYGLYDHFVRPEAGDRDSTLACLVGASRWHGFAVNIERITTLRDRELVLKEKAPKAPHHVYHYLSQVMSESELLVFDEKKSTKKVVLEEISKWVNDDGSIPPAAVRAKECLDARKAANKVTLYNKLIQAGRLHASSTVIGSLSSRMSGRTEVGDGKKSASLNALGIQHDKEIRSCFPLAFGGLVLNGGDFEGYEVAIADARYNDANLRRQLLTCNICKEVFTPDQYRDLTYCPHCGQAYDKCVGCKVSVPVREDGTTDHNCGHVKLKGDPEIPVRKIHALFAMALHPTETYDSIVASKGSSNDMYDKGKRSFFGGLLYGGDENTICNRVGIDLEVAREARTRFFIEYKGIQASQREIFDAFCSMRQPNGIGTKVFWKEPKEYVESLNGFRRYFTLENAVCKALFQLAEKPPKSWDQLDQKVYRRDRYQKVAGAVRSAVLSCAFQIQAQNMRAATNHEIQATGAILCKILQSKLWSLQPAGVHPWMIQPFNIHDEIMCPTHPSLVEETDDIVRTFINEQKGLVPLLKMAWKTHLKDWSGK